MQPMYRPPMPPQGMRPPGAYPPGSTGLPPPQRPPAGYRPSFPAGNVPPGPVPGAPPGSAFPPVSMSSTSSPSMIKPPFNPPVQKMADMKIDQSSGFQQGERGSSYSSDPFQLMSNGIPDGSKPLSAQSISNSTQMGNQPSYTNAQIREPPPANHSNPAATPTSTQNSDFLNKKFQKDSLQGDQVPPSQSPALKQGPSSTPDITSSFPSPSSATLAPSHQQTLPSPNYTGHGPNTCMPSSMESMNSLNTSVVGSRSGPMVSPQSGMSLPNRMMSPQPGMPSSNNRMMPPQPGMPVGSPRMMPPQPGMPSNSPRMPPQPGMPPSSHGMMPPQPGMPSGSPRMMPPQPGMPTSSPRMMPPQMGMQPPGSHMASPRPGMPPPGSHAGTPGPNMPPTSSYMGQPPHGMAPPTSSHTGPPRPGMPPPPGGFMGPPPGAAVPPSPDSHMQQSQFGGMQPPPRPGMPPPPAAFNSGAYMGPPGAGMPPPPSGTHPGEGASPPGMPPPPAPGSAIGGMQNRYPGAGPAGAPMGNYPQGSQGRRLNPDDMPSPLQVIDEDRQARTGEFVSNLKGGVPPLVTTDFVVKDGGNASPRFIRSTMYNIPATQDMMKQASVPFGVVISPLADLYPGEAPIYHGTSLASGPVRCNRCKGYMSPLMMFMDGGRRFQCLLCKQINEVPADYYCHMDSQGARADKFQRPELCLGAFEYVATQEYCKDKLLPKEPAFIFVMEMSQMMVQRGIISLLCQNMKSILAHLPRDVVPGQESAKSSIRVGFITYDSSVHFYKLSGLAPEMCIVCDREDMFVPVPDGVLCDVEEVADNIDKLMESIPQNFQTTRETSGALSCAIQAGMSALKASGRAGKLFVFHSSLPQTGLGKLKNREDRKVLGTDKEKAILSPQTTHYNNLAQDLVSVGCGVDLYLFNESYIDLATIGQVSRLTGGQCYKYTFFQLNKDSERLLNDLRINIGRNIVFDSVMRVRTSTGVRPVEFYGHFFMSNTHDVELAVVDSSKAVVVEVKHDDKITEEDGVYIQVALLYTSVGGQRRLRILNLALNICTQMADLYKNCELDALINFFGKQSMFKFLETTAKQIKENLIARTAQILACYRKNCATPSSAGQLILPELMKILPLYMNCLTKCDALSGGQDLTCDDRSWHIYQMSTMNVDASVVYFYPRLVPLTDIDEQEVGIPDSIRTSFEKLSPDGVYLVENGLFMFMWVGSGTSSAWMKDVFGVAAPHQLDPVLAELPLLENPTSNRVRGVIGAIREQRKLHVRLFVVPQQGKHEVVMRNYLVEDKGVFGAPSYVDFLCHVHKEIRALLS